MHRNKKKRGNMHTFDLDFSGHCRLLFSLARCSFLGLCDARRLLQGCSLQIKAEKVGRLAGAI